MHLLTVPPGGRSKAHKHENHETAIYIISGETNAWYGERLENHIVIHTGDVSISRRACRTWRPTSATSPTLR